jgi:uncharacterized protein
MISARLRHHESLLRILDNEIAARCGEMVAARGDWPCQRGCDHCCRNLAREPELTEAEWLRLRPYVTTIEDKGPRVCPLLDTATGACRVYDVRPIACRTYGFYVERDQGLYCHIIREGVERGEFDGVIWGNGSAVEKQLTELGERRPLREWLRSR